MQKKTSWVITFASFGSESIIKYELRICIFAPESSHETEYHSTISDKAIQMV